MAIEILIVDDNADIRNILNEMIIDAGYQTRLAANYNQAISEIDKKIPDVAILDVKLDKGDNDGIELLSHIKSKNKDVPVIIITGHANIEMAVNSLKHGAFEFVEKPFDQTRLLNFVSRAVENLKLKSQNKEYENKLFSSYELIGDSKNIENIRDQIDKISITDSRVLINGPSGSGKELIARKIHKKSKRSSKSFIILNGALLDFNKYELELFGEERNDGSISYGALEKANKGTLLIDQVSDIPLDIQSKILRVLTDQKFKRLNGNKDINVDVHVVIDDVHEGWRRDVSRRRPLAIFASTVNRFNDWNKSHLQSVRQAIVAPNDAAVVLTWNLFTPTATPRSIRNHAVSTQWRRSLNQHFPREISAPRRAAILQRARKWFHSPRALRHRALAYFHPLSSRDQKAPRVGTPRSLQQSASIRC